MLLQKEVSSSKKRNLQKARKFSNVFRFLDNLCAAKFENNFNDIYPHELELKKENQDPCKASFLDLSRYELFCMISCYMLLRFPNKEEIILLIF